MTPGPNSQAGRRHSVGAVVVAHGPEPLLRTAVEAVLASHDVDVTVALVDNGCSRPDLALLSGLPGVVLVAPGRNTGFAAGCNLGAAAVAGDVVVLVNSDAVVAPGALAALADALRDDRVGLVCGQVVLWDRPGVVNTVGNPVHYSLMSWAGGWGDAVEQHGEDRDVAAATGCLLGVRRADWDRLGGFNEALFAYGEDVELSVRTRLSGRAVRYVSRAGARHAYAFGRNPDKYYLLERNRWVNLLTLYQGRTLLLLAPPLLLLEAGTTVAAVCGGWMPQKARAWWWLVRNAGEVKRRRGQVQAARRRDDAVLVPWLTARIEPAAESGVGVPRWANSAFAAYWRWVGPRIAAQPGRRSRSTASTASAARPSP